MLLHVFYLLFKPISNLDRAFMPPDKITLHSMIQRLKHLGLARATEYNKEIGAVESYWKKARKHQVKLERRYNRLDGFLRYLFFDRFNKRWESFRKADWAMRSIFILCLSYGWFYLFLIMLYVEGNESVIWHEQYIHPALIMTLILFFVALLFGFGLFILYATVLLQVLAIIRPSNGAIQRNIIIGEELLKSLKPGGRKASYGFQSWGKEDDQRWMIGMPPV